MEEGGTRLRLSNLDKVFWPEEGYTKGDLLAYYWNVRDLILPYLRDRPLTMKRMPNGIAGRVLLREEPRRRTRPTGCPLPRPVDDDEAKMGYNDFLMANEAAGLLFVVNLGAIEFHPLHSRCERSTTPTTCSSTSTRWARASRTCSWSRSTSRWRSTTSGCPAYAKTSGATGVQIYVGGRPRRYLRRGPRASWGPSARRSARRPGPRDDGVEDRGSAGARSSSTTT